MSTSLNEAEVKALVDHWYFLLDVHADVQELLPLVADEGLEMVLPETAPEITVRGEGEFRSWYEGVIRIFFDELHVMQSLDITLAPDGTKADVQLVVKWLARRWPAPAPRSEWLGFDAFQRWEVVSSPHSSKPVIQRYIVDELRPLAGSAAL